MMDNKQFSFRRFIESDAETLYDECMKYSMSNIQPYFSAVGVGMKKDDFLARFQQFSRKQYRPPVIANADDKPCGINRITYSHANRYHELMLYFWAEKALVKPVLERIIDEAFSKSVTESSLLMEVPGYEPELKEAAESLGLELVCRIPNYLCHDDELHHKYIYVTSSEKWHSM